MIDERYDIYAVNFSQILSILEPMPPVTAECDAWGTVCKSQKAHMVNWFATQGTCGSGAYSRSKPNESSKTAYNRLQNPGAMLWIAEVLGEEPDRLRQAAEAASSAEDPSPKGRSKAFRAVIPFSRILALLDTPWQWRYDEAMWDLLEFDPDTTEPYIEEEKQEAYMDILKKELGT